MAVIGVDVGSTSVKAVHMEGAGVRRCAVRPLDARLNRAEGHYEEDAARVLELTAQVIDETSDGKIEAICFTGQMHGGLVTDADNRPLTPLITWQDRRTAASIAAITARAPADTWDGVGCPLRSGFLGATVCWLVENGRLPAAGWRVHGVHEWVACALLGLEPYTDPSGGAAWGLYDVRAQKWSDDALRACRVPVEALPRVVPSGRTVGRVDSHPSRLCATSALSCRTRLAGRAVISGVGDTQASFIGAACAPDELLINFGTGSQVLWSTDTFERCPGTDIRPLGQHAGRYLMTIPTLAGGAAYARLADFFRDVVRTLNGTELSRDAVYEIMNAAAASTDGGGLTASPLFNGSRVLGEDTRASLAGIDTANFTLANVTRAVLVGMVEELASLYDAVPAKLRRHRGLLGSGNGLRRNATLQRIVQTRFGLPLRLSNTLEEAACGAAAIAQQGLP